MEPRQEEKHKTMSVEEIITDLYEQHERETSQLSTLVGRLFLSAFVALILGVSFALYQWLGKGAFWGWIVVAVCAIVIAGCCLVAFISCIPLGFSAKYADADFHILVGRALQLKYGEFSDEIFEHYMKSQFVLDFINRIRAEKMGLNSLRGMPTEFISQGLDYIHRRNKIGKAL